MAVMTDNGYVFLHIPKTAGSWIRHFLKVNKIGHNSYACDQGLRTTISGLMLRKKEIHHLPNVPSGSHKKVICVVRNPVFWYKSFFAFRTTHYKYGWNVHRPFDNFVRADNFTDFIRKVMFKYPDGFLNQLYKEYTSKCTEVWNIDDLRDKVKELFGPNVFLPESVNVTQERRLSRQLILEIMEYEKELMLQYFEEYYEGYKNNEKLHNMV